MMKNPIRGNRKQRLILDRLENLREGFEGAPDRERSKRASSGSFTGDAEGEDQGERAANPRRHKGVFRRC